MTSYEEAYAYLERHVDALKTNRTGDERQTDAPSKPTAPATSVRPMRRSSTRRPFSPSTT